MKRKQWPDLPVMIAEYIKGGACSEIAAIYRHSPRLFSAHLKSAGVWRDRATVQKVAPRPSRVLRDFVPMLTVSVADGVLLNRMAEVLAPMDRFEVRRCEA